VLRDDRVLAYTRVLSLAIVPFLLAAFVVLYLLPGDTKRLFAWPIKPTMTSMVLASAYFGGAYFFVRVVFEPRWNVVKTDSYPSPCSRHCWVWPQSCTGTSSTIATSPSGSGPAST
jgi:hypothetical protein